MSPACTKNGGAPGIHCLHMRLISPKFGDSGLFSDSSVSCDIRVWTRYSEVVDNTMACNESSDFQQVISHALQRLATPSMVHMRFGKLSSSFNIISNWALILDVIVFPG